MKYKKEKPNEECQEVPSTSDNIFIDEAKIGIIRKRFKNKSGDIEVRQTDNCGIVEIMHYWKENKSGCVIGYWSIRNCDGDKIAEFQSVQSRIIETEYDDPTILLEALKFGQKLADILLEVA